jgi:hypothetical protein
MKIEEIKKDIQLLSKERPLFHSEADFQHALAWVIHKNHPDLEVRLEKREIINGKEIYFDICMIYDNHIVPIEVKYKTSALKIEIKKRLYTEEYLLKDQSAMVISRYDFIKDIARIKELGKSGFAIFLTNNKLYWEKSIYSRNAFQADKKLYSQEKKPIQDLIWHRKTFHIERHFIPRGIKLPICQNKLYRLTSYWKNSVDLALVWPGEVHRKYLFLFYACFTFFIPFHTRRNFYEKPILYFIILHFSSFISSDISPGV